MKITLISLDPELYCIGLRILSSCLRADNHSVQMIFMPSKQRGNRALRTHYPEYVLEQVAHICSDSYLIGISLMTNQFIQAVRLTDYLKTHGVKAPVVWGGIHPTVEPEICLEHADIVCMGEGEDALMELAERMENDRDFMGVENMWFRGVRGTVRNPVRPLRQNLDSLPFPDYSCQDHFLASSNGVEELTKDKFVSFRGERFHSEGKAINYPILTSRGCPFACTYCCNSVYRRIYPAQKHLRWRSTENVIQELKMIRRQIAPIACVIMVDDNFTARSDDQLKRFCDMYRAEINAPFFAQVSPLTINGKKMETLLDSGCIKVVMGVETGSERVARMYGRSKSHAAVPDAISIIEAYRDRMPLPPSYQFIIDNPYETIEETIETLRLAVSLPRPWDNPIYSLMLFPGTPLYEKAWSEGLIKSKQAEVYEKDWVDQSRPFLQLWIRLYRANITPLLLRLLLFPWVLRVLSSHFADKAWRFRVFRWLWKTQ